MSQYVKSFLSKMTLKLITSQTLTIYQAVKMKEMTVRAFGYLILISVDFHDFISPFSS